MRTIEEKAKRYDEIIEKANKMHSENCEACQMCIEELIPELKESEDEKIIQFLIHEVKETSDEIMSYRGMNKEAVLAWLEKQQKPAAWSEEDESYLNTTIAYLKDAKEFKKTAENCINWLKSLRPQKQ